MLSPVINTKVCSVCSAKLTFDDLHLTLIVQVIDEGISIQYEVLMHAEVHENGCWIYVLYCTVDMHLYYGIIRWPGPNAFFLESNLGLSFQAQWLEIILLRIFLPPISPIEKSSFQYGDHHSWAIIGL